MSITTVVTRLTGLFIGAIVFATLLPGNTWADSALQVKEPDKSFAVQPRTPERQRWSWNQTPAEITTTGDLQWKPEPFVFDAGPAPRYIDFDAGNDANSGEAKDAAWKHHPWDPAAAGKAKECKGLHAYVFKRGVVYRGALVATESGEAGNPIQLTSDPAWGSGDAVICGSQRVTGWKQGATNKDIPDPEKVWYADVDFLPRNVWEINDGKVERIPLTRMPHWKVSNPDDVMGEWWTWEQPEWWANKCKIKTREGPRHIGIDTKHLTGPAELYVGATLRTEYGIVMTTPFPTRVESYDAKRKGIVFQGIWLGDSEVIATGMRYYLEDKPQFLDVPGEFWFERTGTTNAGRLFIRLPGDRNPNTSIVEAGKEINFIQDAAAANAPDRYDYFKPEQMDKLDTNGISHVRISGLTFRFQNTAWDLTLPGWGGKDIFCACIRLLGSGKDIRIANCKFEHVNRGIRIEPIHMRCRVDDVVVCDNEFTDLDHGAVSIGRGRDVGTDNGPPGSRLGTVKVLRNKLFMIGMRQPRQDPDFAIVIDHSQLVEVAGNITDRTYSSGIFVMRGKDVFGPEPGEAPLTRALVHGNRVVDSLLAGTDWGGIEVNGGGPAFVYNNISGRPNGRWMWSYSPTKPGSGRLGMAYYLDGGGSKTYVFNNVAFGHQDDAKMPLANCAFYEAGPNILNTFFNNTISDFYMGSNWSPAGGRYMSLGNLWMNVESWVFMHGKVKEDKDPPPAGEYPLFSDAYGKNVFYNTPAVAVFEADGRPHADIASMNAALVEKKSLCDDVGIKADASPVQDAAANDFRLKPDSPAIAHGVKVFVPWPLYRMVGEWNFRRNNAEPGVLLDDHFYPTSYYTDRIAYTKSLLFPLKASNVTADDYVPGPLNDWTVSALKFNGKDQYASLSQEDMTKPFTFSPGGRKPKQTVSGKEIASPDIDTSNFLVEVYFRTEANHTGGVLVSKLADDAGYQLAINKAGGVTLTAKSAGQVSQLACGARINDGQWHHVIAEVDRTAKTATIYVDGVKAADGAFDLANGVSLSNAGDLLVGKGTGGNYFAGAMDFLRIARGTLADARTTIEELYDWEFDGPSLRDFRGLSPATGKPRDAGAFQDTDK